MRFPASFPNRLAVLGLLGAAAALQAQSVLPPTPAPGPFRIFFDWESTELTADSTATLDNAAAAYQQVRGGSVELFGHSDRSGPAAVNLRISAERAEAVRQYLLDRAVPAAAIRITALGERRPTVPTDDGVREARNRSVEIRLVAPRLS